TSYDENTTTATFSSKNVKPGLCLFSQILDCKYGEIDELKSMYRGKQKEADETIWKLEKRVQSLLQESQVIRQTKEKQISELKKMSDQSAESLKNEWEKKVRKEMEQEKFELQKNSQTQGHCEYIHTYFKIHIASISAELQEANHSFSDVRDCLKGYGFIAYYECSLCCCQASEVIEGLEQTGIHLKQQIQEAENRRQKQLRVSRSHFFTAFHTDSKRMFILHFVLVIGGIHNLKHSNKDKEEQLVRLRDSQRHQAQQAESTLESFKKQVELSSEKTYADMKQQMEKVEADLIRSKSLREKQSKEFSYQLEELQRRYVQQIVELKLQHEQERTHLLQTHNAEKDSLVQDHQREIDSLDKQARAAMIQQQTQTQEWRKRDDQTISDLEAQVHSLRKDLLAAHSQRKQKLTELGVLREEERQRAAQDQQAALDRLRGRDGSGAVLQELVESLQRQLHAVEKKLMSRELEYQEQITHVRQESESKIKGLIPAELQQELEDTITSLKSQVIKQIHTPQELPLDTHKQIYVSV
uniref:Centrosomal protein 112 n=1 Tax=Sinocyclocheilus rhinocerous TaxID=307959 RepID=A0A673IIB7_9TELE